jgi:hypothetical protein
VVVKRKVQVRPVIEEFLAVMEILNYGWKGVVHK